MRCLFLLCVLACGCTTGASPPVEPVDKPADDPTPVPHAAAGGKAGSDWPGFLGPTGDSVSSEKGIITPWPKNGLRVLWHRKVGVGYAVPSISKGKLFLFDRHGGKARLSCMDRQTTKLIWKFEYPTDYRDKFGYNGGPRCCPVIDDDRVYIHGAEGMLHCVRGADGELLWKADTLAQFGVVQNFFGVGSTPVVEGDLLIVPVGGSPKGSDPDAFDKLKGNGSGVVAFDKRTGKVKYAITDELASFASPVLATINGRRWCFVLARGGLIAFEPASGKVDFHFPWRAVDFESANASNPVVVGDRVFLSETYGPGAALLKVRPGGYDLLWSDLKKVGRGKSMQCHWMTPMHVDGYLYGCSGRHAEVAELRCIELATGKVMWREPNLTRTSLLLVDGHFVCLGEDGVLLLLKVNPKRYEEVSKLELTDAKTGTPLLRYPCWAAPIVSHGLMYVRSEDRLVCLELIPEGRE